VLSCFFFQAEDGIRDFHVTGVQTCALPILGINVWEVIEAASTKPFGFTPFYPGPGLGGHCIPVDPHYLSWKLKTLDYRARFIERSEERRVGKECNSLWSRDQ